MQSLKALAQSTLGEIKDALVEAVGDDEDEEEGRESNVSDRLVTPSPTDYGGHVDCDRQFAAKAGGELSTLPKSPCLSEDSEMDPCQHEQHEAHKEYAALCQLPGLEATLQSLGVEANAFSCSTQPSAARMAITCCRVLRQALPQVMHEAGEPSETRRLLTSFSERYEQLLEEHMGLQRKCRDLTSKNVKFEALAQQAEAWQSAHQAAIARIEELSSENADLKEQAKLLKQQGIDPKERLHLQQRLIQKDAELQASMHAMRKLEEVMEEQNALVEQNASLKRELRELLTRAEEARESPKVTSVAPETNNNFNQLSDLSARCHAAETELKETSAALEFLLREKGRRLEDEEFLVDRRLVASMLSLYHEHLASGQRALAEQILAQALSILGVPKEAQRSQRSAAQARLAEPLGDAFLDFLEKEATESGTAIHAAGEQTLTGSTLLQPVTETKHSS